MSAESDVVTSGYAGPERRSRNTAPDMVIIRLTRKYAQVIDGVDISAYRVGDRLPVPASDAKLLLAEGWAEPVPAHQRRAS